MAKYTEENLRKAEQNYGRAANFQKKAEYFQNLKGRWKKKGIIPDKYVEMEGWGYIPRKKAQTIRKILSIPEINYCRLVDQRFMFRAVLAEIRLGNRFLYEWEYRLMEKGLADLRSRIDRFTARPVEPTIEYFEALNKVMDDDRLIKKALHRAVDVKTKPMIFKFFPYHRKKYGAYAPKLINNYRLFFEGLHQELKSLSERLRLE
ncbi:hypothetical protein [Sinomicrobium weinanense]|uniref:Uncharacterized protein n=1 Tax=Sinomicrobium weinanense TaxID=2842200 RepID=A0A926JUT0_9FLAO|nr:hypothetical protein [Sinomicrobium weinanense]MBC9797870.1 hypothetical protein [Sinomicrobium weinanense]MBU3122230.1 hypothetical protein [Sinomicrobium weinanense]